MVAVLLVLLAAPLLVLLGAVFRGLILAYPVMILLGALHSVAALSFVPALGFWPSVGVVALLGLLIPTSDTSSNK